MTDMLIFSIGFACLAVINLYRLVKGPTGADRMVAADSVDILLCCAMVLFSLYSGRGVYLDIAIISALLYAIFIMNSASTAIKIAVIALLVITINPIGAHAIAKGAYRAGIRPDKPMETDDYGRDLEDE